jgi:hypothetical protein
MTSLHSCFFSESESMLRNPAWVLDKWHQLICEGYDGTAIRYEAIPFFLSLFLSCMPLIIPRINYHCDVTTTSGVENTQ